jgi:hypothetical protein
MSFHALPVAIYAFLMPFLMPIMILIECPMFSVAPMLCWRLQADPLACRKLSRVLSLLL